MDCQELINELGYKGNPAFLQKERLKEHPGYSFFFAQAEKMEECATFHGVYALVHGSDSGIASTSITPLVYVFEAGNEHQAANIHKKVWCQNTVPYVIVTTPKNIRLYSGFEYDQEKTDDDRAIEVVRNANQILNRLSAFTAKAIDSRTTWEKQIIPIEKRVDRRLLVNLKTLSSILTSKNYGLAAEDAHTLIGKYIYLKYLRDRDILSNKRLTDAGLVEGDVYSRSARKENLYRLEEYLDGFLNGSVFPLPNKNRIDTNHIQKIAGAFKGDDTASGQQILFDLYDFSYVPIETLSVVYQQFLHQEGRGRTKGAYYTPIHLVNFLLDELESKTPLQKGMRVFDPSCGSGAFLVQCYRRLIERTVRKEGKLNPSDLRQLLTDSIFGLDADIEACRVAQLSLSLTLLDYIEPKDLSTYPTFKLPNLHNKNVFHCKKGFFDENSDWSRAIPKGGYNWIVGNPPWKSKYNHIASDQTSLDWINTNKNRYPVGKQQLAEAFAWKASTLLANDGLCGILMPALTLFKKQGDKFRGKFFSNVETWCVVNFSNLRHILFEEAVNPAAAFFFTGQKDWDREEHYITTYAPFAVEQAISSKIRNSKRIWSIFVNSSAIKELSLKDIQDGSSLPWKIAMWGTHRDKILLDKIGKHCRLLKNFIRQHKLAKSEGLQLRKPGETPEELVLVNEIRGKKKLLMNSLKGLRDIHFFPEGCFEVLSEKQDYYTRTGRKEKPLRICQSPHICMDASRRFVVFSNEFFVIPARQIGIAGYKSQEAILKALALYLKSDFVNYQQWLTSAAWGIERDRPNLDDLMRLPVPFCNVGQNEFMALAKLHDEIVEANKYEQRHKNTRFFNKADADSSVQSSKVLLKEMNTQIYKLLGVDARQRWQIEDLLNVRLKLNEGRISREAIKSATKTEIADFARIFQERLDLFLDSTGNRKVHKVVVYLTNTCVVLIVDHLRRSIATTPEFIEVCDRKTQEEFENIQNKLTLNKSQWIYFTRCLRFYEDRRTYIFKPRQKLYWLKSQAIVEADEFLEEKVGAK